MLPLRLTVFLVFLCGSLLHAQIPPPPETQGGFPDEEIPRRQWTVAVHGSLFGYSPCEIIPISGQAHFERIPAKFGVNWLRSNDGRTRLAITANTSFGISAGTMISNKKGTLFHTFEGKFEQNKALYCFKPPFYFQLDGRVFDTWVMTDKYFNAGIAYQLSFSTKAAHIPIPPDFLYFRVACSQTFYHRNFTERIQQGRYEDWTENGTGMYATTIQATPRSYMVSLEVGARTFSPEWDRSFDYGFAAHLPFETAYTDQYEFVYNNTSAGTANTVYSGATYMVNLRYTFNIKPKTKVIDTTRPPDIYVLTDTTREVDVQESFTVRNKRVKIAVWDRNEVDGDIVSLYLNDELVKKNLRLKKRKKRITVKLQPGSNILVMYAENLGTIPPNTAALQIKDGKKKRNVTLVSDNGKSGAVELIYRPK